VRRFEAQLRVSDAMAAAHPGFLASGKPKYLGVYETEDDAARALDRMLIKLLGDDATSDMLNVRPGRLRRPICSVYRRLLNASLSPGAHVTVHVR
jgi:hypothetical protein